MNRLSDIISRIFSTDQTQGLSGGAEVVIDRDPASAFYASRLRKHRTDEDLVETPTWLWATLSYNGRKGGLRTHVHAERGEGVASFTDVLVVLNQTDARRAAQVEGEPWTERAARAISEKFAVYCQRERFELLYGTRPLRFWFVADGGQDMLGHSFGLGPGEFITGLLPNLYVGPAPRSRAVLAVHLHLPGAWEGYREVGRLYSDQILYTLGRHWLDNFHHPSLKEPGLYRLQQFPDGSLVHVISPELQDRYFVRSDALDGGASVLTIAQRSGNPVAYLVLAVIDTPATADPGMTVGVPLAALKSAGLLDDVDPDQGTVPIAISLPSQPTRDMLQRTIIPDAVEARMLTLHERGALLQRVHFANFMDGYDVYIGSSGRIATQMQGPMATLQVRGGRVSVLVNEDGVRIDGRPIAIGSTVPLTGIAEIEVDGHSLHYRDLTGIRIEGWPYVGELRRPGAGTYLDFGGVYRIGRDRRCQVRLPDEPHNENIAWLPQVGTGTTIRSRSGDIPKSRFYTDSIMVASEHAELDLTAEPVLRSLARHCYTFVRRGGEILPLVPREAGDGRHDLDLRANDEVLVGNCLFQVSYPPGPGAAPTPEPAPLPAPPPAPELKRPSAQELASSVDAPTTFDEHAGDAPTSSGRPQPRPAPRAQLTYDPAVAAGLGESGPAPRPPRFREQAPPPPTPVPPAPVPPAPPAPAPSPSPAAFGLAGGSIDAPPPPAPAGIAPTPQKRFKSAVSIPDTDAPPPPPTEPPRPSKPVAPAHTSPPAELNLFARPSRPVATPGLPARAEPSKPPPPMLIEPPTEDHTPPPRDAILEEPIVVEASGDDPNDPVLSVEEARWKLELARPARLVQTGWMVAGEAIVGNHAAATVVVPEVRAFKEQAFLTLDYFRLSLRGRKGRVELLQEGEASLHVGGAAYATTDDVENAALTIIRRDANLEPDFDIALRIRRDESLPDPRAQLVEVDTSDRLVAALFTLGFPLRADRRLRTGKLVATYRYTGSQLQVSDYLATYHTPQGFLPCFFRTGDRAWQTFPEDGGTIEIASGDSLMIGNVIYRFTAG